MSVSLRDERKLQRLYGAATTQRIVKSRDLSALVGLMGDIWRKKARKGGMRRTTARVFVNTLERSLAKCRSNSEREMVRAELARYQAILQKSRGKKSPKTYRKPWDSGYYVKGNGIHGATPRRFQERGGYHPKVE